MRFFLRESPSESTIDGECKDFGGSFMKKILAFCKGEPVLSIAALAALVTCFFTPPSAEYIGYIDVRTLGILFCLMAVMAGLQKIGLFRFVAEKLLGKVKHIKGLVFIIQS
jgi:Na+/H+ antiporter NhaD/arsenite permease-like protein